MISELGNMSKIRVGLLFGGCSGEHEVSIISAGAIATGLQLEANRDRYDVIPFYIQKDGIWISGDAAQAVLTSGKPPVGTASTVETAQRWQFPSSVADVEIWFPVLHGPNGEDGTIQGLLQLMRVPFVGSGVMASAIGMDKIAMKIAFAQAGIPQVNYLAVDRCQIVQGDQLTVLCDQIQTTLGFPCFVKPANLGSSVGIAKARNLEQLQRALQEAASYDRRVIVEQGVVAREVECAVLGTDLPQASVVGEITFDSDFYDYETKYTLGKSNLYIPATLPLEITENIQEMAIAAFKAIDAAGLSRVDFFYIEATGEVLLNEINTFPGFTATSMYPQLWEASGIPFAELVHRLIQFGLERALPTLERVEVSAADN